MEEMFEHALQQYASMDDEFRSKQQNIIIFLKLVQKKEERI